MQSSFAFTNLNSYQIYLDELTLNIKKFQALIKKEPNSGIHRNIKVAVLVSSFASEEEK